MKPLRRSSASISLVLIGAAALATTACRTTEQPKRDVYTSRKDCEQDWNADPAKCEPVDPSGESSYSGGQRYSSGHYWGPMYFPSYGYGGLSRPSSRAIGSVAVPRGGFGSTARSGSSGPSSSGGTSSAARSGSGS